MADVNRRTVLRALTGGYAGVVATGTPAAGRHTSGDRAGPRTVRAGDADSEVVAETGDHVDAGAVSLRAVGEFVDAEHRPKRLYGNGPPFAPGRSDVPPVRKVAYCWSPGCDIADASTWTRYLVYDGTADENAYDLGMANRIPDGLPSGVDLSQKGLVESHRWISPADGFRTRRQAQQPPGEDGTPEPPTPEYRSIRTVADRHADGHTHRCAWLNTKLLGGSEGVAPRRDRARTIGRMFGAADYDVVTLGEVDKVEYALDISAEYARRYATAGGSIDYTFDRRGLKRGKTDVYAEGDLDSQITLTYGPNRPGSQPLNDSSGLHSIVGHRDGDRAIRRTNRTVYDTGTVQSIQQSYQRLSIGTPNGGFEVFCTHLASGPNDVPRKKRKQQLDELTDAISDRQDDLGEWPKVAVGDFNVHADRDFGDDAKLDYEGMLDAMGDVDMQEAWLTYGGPVGKSGHPACRPDSDDEGRFSPHCHCDDYELSRLREVGRDGGRIDFAFVEKPKPGHSVTLDVSRIWRIATTGSCGGLRSLASGNPFAVSRDRYQGALTDHAGLGFALLTSPK